MANGNPVFEQTDKLWDKSEKMTTDTKPISIYMSCRFLSLHPAGFMPAYDCNRIHGLPEWAALPFLQNSLPKQRRPTAKYPKKLAEGKKLTEKKKLALKRICKKFNVSEFHGLQIVGLLEQQGFKLESN